MNHAAIKIVASRARSALAQAESVPSPCVGVCAMDAATGWCSGCLRQLDEIAAWSGMDDDAKRTVWCRIRERAPQVLGHT